MIYTSNYGKLREASPTDIPAILRVMRPFVESGKILPRNENDIISSLNDYIVYEIDEGIHACGALHFYEDGQAEIAAIAVEESFANMGIGPKLVKFLIERAKNQNTKTVFILTTQASDWFEKLGFVLDTVDSLPEKRKLKWNPQRNSKVFRFNFK
jgi:amino-acid N-acetyltransferase